MGTELQLVGAARTRSRPAPKSTRGRATERSGRDDFPDIGVVLFDESADAFLRFYRRLVVALHPSDAFEEILVERITTSAWRLRRAYRIESGLFSKARVSVHNGKLRRTRNIELVFLRLTSDDDTLAKLARYEASLERSLYKSMQQLTRQQARRRLPSSINCRGIARLPG